MEKITRTNTGIIEVVRYDYDAHDESRFGKRVHVPAYYVERYLYGGRQIAYYDGRRGALDLNSDCLYYDRKWMWDEASRLPIYERALVGKYRTAFTHLFAVLDVTAQTKLGEYINL